MLVLFSFIIALFLSLVALPVLIRLSWRLHLVDAPGERKVHSATIPRCGGIAIAGATLLPVAMWVPMDPTLGGYLGSAAIVVAFALLDDFRGMNAWTKFAGQGVAVAVAMASGIVFEHLPFFGMDPAPAWVTYPVTALFLLGITNAVNLFDGLDGLAGGCAALSLAAIGLLAWQGEGSGFVLMAAAVIGGIFGFLRYNTHPATVFMGDTGSQFLGFTSAVLCILLVERADPALNPALPLLLLGVPVLDTLMVMTQRLWERRALFSGDRNHIHHKLLDIGLAHYEAVACIYIAQGLMIAAAFSLRHASDAVVVGAFVAFAAVVIGPLSWLRATRRRVAGREGRRDGIERRNLWLRRRTRLPAASLAGVRYGVMGLVLLAAVVPVPVGRDAALAALGLGGMMLVAMLLGPAARAAVVRVGIFGALGLAGYQLVAWAATDAPARWILGLSVAALCAVLAAAYRVSRRDLFRVTPQDLLVLLFAVAIPNLSGEILAGAPVVKIALILIILFYASEFVITRDDRGRWMLGLASLLSLCAIGVRGGLL